MTDIQDRVVTARPAPPPAGRHGPAVGRSRMITVLAALLVAPLVLVVNLLFLSSFVAASPASVSEPPLATGQPPQPQVSAPAPIDTDGDGVTDDVDAYPQDGSRHSTSDRDGDGAANETDVAPDDRLVQSWPTGVVTSVIDGDTIEVAGSGRVRLTGIDAPEIGECGYDAATAKLEGLVANRQVTLVPGGRDDRDRYNRLLRYVDVAGADAGRELISAGLAIARYDSRDGYGAHPREADYVAADAASPNITCAPAPAAAAAAPVPAPTAAAEAPVAPNAKESAAAKATPRPAAPASPAAEPWNRPGPDLDCADIGHPVRITGTDYHRLDRDGDGWGCDS